MTAIGDDPTIEALRKLRDEYAARNAPLSADVGRAYRRFVASLSTIIDAHDERQKYGLGDGTFYEVKK